MNRTSPKLLLILLMLFAVAAGAADLDSAKSDGLVGERADGYLGLVVESASSDVRQLVASVNAKRRAEYERIATSNNLTVAQVQALAGKKAIERTRSGHFIFLNGGWQRK